VEAEIEAGEVEADESVRVACGPPVTDRARHGGARQPEAKPVRTQAPEERERSEVLPVTVHPTDPEIVDDESGREDVGRRRAAARAKGEKATEITEIERGEISLDDEPLRVEDGTSAAEGERAAPGGGGRRALEEPVDEVPVAPAQLRASGPRPHLEDERADDGRGFAERRVESEEGAAEIRPPNEPTDGVRKEFAVERPARRPSEPRRRGPSPSVGDERRKGELPRGFEALRASPPDDPQGERGSEPAALKTRGGDASRRKPYGAHEACDRLEFRSEPDRDVAQEKPP
jgi:hypothetical protein